MRAERPRQLRWQLPHKQPDWAWLMTWTPAVSRACMTLTFVPRTGFTFPTENDFPDVPGNGKLPVFRFFPDFPIGKRFEIQISVFDIFRPDFGVF